MRKKLQIHFVSDIATPHVNRLLRALTDRPEVELSIWYAAPDPSALYPDSKENPTHAVLPARIFGKDSPSPALIRRALLDRNAIWILVGWSNPSTRALIPLLSVLGRSYGFYTDEPAPSQGGPSARRAARDVYLRLLRRRATVFATRLISSGSSWAMTEGFP